MLHFGADVCNRVLVLRNVGYSVDICPSVAEFCPPLEERAETDAVVVSALPGRDRSHVVTFTCEHSSARLVLFDNSYAHTDEEQFDLIVPPLMHPEEWLRLVAALIERSRDLNRTTAVIRERSALLRKDSETLRLNSMIQRERSVSERADPIGTRNPNVTRISNFRQRSHSCHSG